MGWNQDIGVPVQQGGPVLARVWQAVVTGPAEYGPGALRWLEARVDAFAAEHNLSQVCRHAGTQRHAVMLCSLLVVCLGHGNALWRARHRDIHLAAQQPTAL